MNNISAIYAGLWIGTWALAVAGFLTFRRKAGKLHQEEELVMSRARQKALSIIQNARDQGVDIIGRSKISATESKSKLEENLSEISATNMREFKNILQTISKTVEGDALKEIEEFKKALELETIQSQKTVAAKMQQNYDQAKAEVEKYKQAQMAQAEAKIDQIVSEVVKDIIGRVIPLEEHQKLIIAALEKAKKQHGYS
ncbi:MAG: hypothetical protein Q7S31_02230 [bacterium]|nr:hypothetical protein [bacterium]